jgi:hypothetical protein
MSSIQYKELKETIIELRRHLLPRKFNNTGSYRERVFTGVIAFRLLSHAAIEEYFEARVTDIAKRASKHCKNSGTASQSAAHLVTFAEEHYGLPPDTLKPPQHNQEKEWLQKFDLTYRVIASASKFLMFVKKYNHGIREKNIIRLLIPIGYRYKEIDPVLLAELDNFGEGRGEFAHSSTSNHIKKRPDPQYELERVNRIVQMIEDIDKGLDRILREIPTE